MIRILSTKKLAVNQKQFLLNAGFAVVEADFIGIAFKQVKQEYINQNLIFTSSNAVKSVLRQGISIKEKPSFCVGDKTERLLTENGFNVVASADNAAALAEIIVERFSSEAFTFFSGNLRLPELPNALAKAGITWNEQEVYETKATPGEVKTKPDGILFFSPSGVESFLEKNTITTEMCFCIGTTTAKALEHRTENIIIANKPSVENVIVQCIRHFQS